VLGLPPPKDLDQASSKRSSQEAASYGTELDLARSSSYLPDDLQVIANFSVSPPEKKVTSYRFQIVFFELHSDSAPSSPR